MTYLVLAAISTLITLTLSIYTFYTYKIRKMKSALIFSLLMLFITIFTAGSFLELAAEDLAIALFWTNICQIGYLAGIIIFWIVFRRRLFNIMPVARDKIMESIKEGIIIIDNFGKVMDKNIAIDGFIKDISSSEYDIIGKNINKLFIDWPQWLSACMNLQETEFEVNSSPRGKKRFYRVKVYPLRARSTKIYGTVSIICDITIEKIKEKQMVLSFELNRKYIIKQAKKLSENEKQLETIIENMSDHCVVVNREGKYTKVNKAAKDFMPELKVNKVGDWLKAASYLDAQGGNLETNGIPASKVLNGEKFENYRIMFKRGMEEIYFDTNGTPVYDDNGNLLFGVICSHNVTEHVRLSMSLESRWKELQNAFENMSDIIRVINKDGTIKFSNKVAREYFPDKEINVPGDTNTVIRFFNMNGDEIPDSNSPINRALRGEQILAERTKLTCGERVRYNSISCTPIYAENGLIEYVVLSAREITNIVEKENIIREQQEQLLKAEIEKNNALQNVIEKMNAITQLKEQNSLKDKLLTIVTHDIRSPMAAMVTLIELLNGEKDHFSEDIIEIIDAVKEQINNTYNIIENLLNWLKSQMDGLVCNPLVWDISRIIQEAANSYSINAKSKDIRITTNTVEGTNVFADKEMLELVLRNLLSNAVKFTAIGGMISIQAFESENEIIVAVKDTGVGIDYDKAKMLFSQEHIFSSAGTAGERGVGLGLLICKEFVQHNGGKIWVDSIPGKGSTFYFSLFSAGINN
jgi:signal transduction histidine kinase